MTVKELITELSKYDENLEVCMDMDVEVDDYYYSGEYYSTLSNLYLLPNDPYLKNFIILFGDTRDMYRLRCEYIDKLRKEYQSQKIDKL